MEQIRATPELWEPLSELAEQYIKTGEISDDDSKGISHLIGYFTAWFQLKNGTDESSYSLIAGILFDLETGRLVATDDVDAARKGFFGNIVDDLSPKEERNA
ncbi:MAG: hypothetical protein K2X76_13355, partial [Sphingomonas sp.]|nr:hypothetical protein [Sphingomonas sp.]